MTEGTSEQEQEQVSLTVNDLQAMISIIDIACAEGAFKGNNLMAVGSIYNKLTTFITAASQQVAAEKPPTTEEHNAAMQEMDETPAKNPKGNKK